VTLVAANAAATSARKARRLAVEAFVVASIVFVAYVISHPDAVATLGRLYDDVVYLSVGKSIADGHGYRSAQLVGTPVHVKFPPLLPVIYALGWRAFGSLDAVARAALWLNLLVAAAAAGTLWWLARRELDVGPVPAALLVIMPILTDRTMFYFSGATSEPWMLLGWATALILVRRLGRRGAQAGAGIGLGVALGLVLAATALARTQGIVIVLAILAAAAVSGVAWRAVAASAVAAATPLVAWHVWHGAMIARGPLSPLPDQSGYSAWIPTASIADFARFATRMMRLSVALYWTNTADVLVGWTSPKTLVLAAVIVVCGVVGVVLVARRFPALAASIVATLGVLAIWPYVQDRFLTPVLPVLGLAGAFAVQRSLDRAPITLRRVALGGATVATCLLLVVNGRARAESVRGGPTSPFAHAVASIVQWVEGSTRPDDRVMVPWGGAIYLRTGRRTSIPNPEEPALGSTEVESPRLYANRLLADSVDDLVIWDRAPGRSATWLQQLATLCPGLLAEAATESVTRPDAGDLHFYRVRRDLPCLTRVAGGAESAGSENKNAP
jgi:hypothetical protein